MNKSNEKGQAAVTAATPPENRVGDSNKPQVLDAGVGEAGNIEKIREILFGAQLRDSEKRYALLKERMRKEITDLRDEIRKSFDSLETYIRKEVDALSDRVKAEQQERGELAKELAAQIGDGNKSLEKKIVELNDQFGKNARELRQQILDQSKGLSDEIRRRHEEATRMLEQTAQGLQDAKIDRAGLSELFTEMALRLTDGAALKLSLESEDLTNE